MGCKLLEFFIGNSVGVLVGIGITPYFDQAATFSKQKTFVVDILAFWPGELGLVTTKGPVLHTDKCICILWCCRLAAHNGEIVAYTMLH